jgi:NAD kinase
MLDVSVERDGYVIYSDYALNDVVAKGRDAHLIDIELYGDGRKMSSFSGTE